jgi:hypothetical protein
MVPLRICQPRVLEGRSGLLDYPTLPFLMCPFLGLGWHFFSYRGCTPPDRLYGITDRSINDDRGL